jgi:hypothetical protein
MMTEELAADLLNYLKIAMMERFRLYRSSPVRIFLFNEMAERTDPGDGAIRTGDFLSDTSEFGLQRLVRLHVDALGRGVLKNWPPDGPAQTVGVEWSVTTEEDGRLWFELAAGPRQGVFVPY